MNVKTKMLLNICNPQQWFVHMELEIMQRRVDMRNNAHIISGAYPTVVPIVT